MRTIKYTAYEFFSGFRWYDDTNRCLLSSKQSQGDGGRSIVDLCHRENLSFGFPTRSDINWAVQPQKMARGWKFWI